MDYCIQTALLRCKESKRSKDWGRAVRRYSARTPPGLRWENRPGPPKAGMHMRTLSTKKHGKRVVRSETPRTHTHTSARTHAAKRDTSFQERPRAAQEWPKSAQERPKSEPRATLEPVRKVENFEIVKKMLKK